MTILIDQEAISGTIPDEIALLWKLENLIMKNNRQAPYRTQSRTTQRCGRSVYTTTV
jgi:hypothetical protein